MVFKLIIMALLIFIIVYLIIALIFQKDEELDYKLNTKGYILSMTYKRISKKGKEKSIYINVSANNIYSLKSKVESFIKDNIKFIVKSGSLVPEKLYIHSSKINLDKDDFGNKDIEKIETEIIKFIRNNDKLNKLYTEVETLRG